MISCTYEQHQKNNSEDEGTYADLKKTKALMAAIDLTLRQYIFTDLEIYVCLLSQCDAGTERPRRGRYSTSD